ncbi:MAG TPA: FAD-dependent oxidoreductase [Candidatus Paceibacterota bacterium]|nr:FAD-dependent oxidoreductase [Candidatus Paceibacterota bacterium]
MHDFIIVGGAAAATSATIYASRRGLKVLVIAKDLGGEVATSGEISNWPGIIHTDGVTLSQQFQAHLRSYDPDILEGCMVEKIEKKGEGHFVVTTDDGKEHKGRAVLVASGVHPRTLNIPGEKEYRLKGVSYCTVCDGPVFKGKVTAVIGGGNAALESALMLSDLSPKVFVINKNPQFKGEQLLIDNLKKKANVEVVYEAMTTEIVGNGKVATGLKYEAKDGAKRAIEAQGMFVHIGQIPNSQIVPNEVTKNEFGEIIVDLGAATSMSGLFAAGDVTNVPHKQIIIAAGQGSAAALSAVQYMNRLTS